MHAVISTAIFTLSHIRKYVVAPEKKRCALLSSGPARENIFVENLATDILSYLDQKIPGARENLLNDYELFSAFISNLQDRFKTVKTNNEADGIQFDSADRLSAEKKNGSTEAMTATCLVTKHYRTITAKHQTTLRI